MEGRTAIRKAPLTSRKFSKIIAGLTADKKAEDVLILDMRAVVNFCDYFVICSGNNERQVKAIADHVEEALAELGHKVNLGKGRGASDWVVMDSGDVVLHIFRKDIREFYGLEYLWQSAKEVKWDVS